MADRTQTGVGVTGADVLCDTLLAGDVDVCFANPGTSEMHFVAALDKRPNMRCVLGLFEGVVTGAADGYARMAEKPAATLLHCGPGLANGLANLHNARRAGSAMVNIVGDHASDHLIHDAPLTSDIEGLASPMSAWVHRISSTQTLRQDTVAAMAAARTGCGRIATLILPADAAWSPLAHDESTCCAPSHKGADGQGFAFEPMLDGVTVPVAATALRKAGRCLVLLGGRALRCEALAIARGIALATGATVMAEQANARFETGRGRHAPARVPYRIDDAVAELAPFDTVILVAAKAPVGFFAYPGKPHAMTADQARILSLVDRDGDVLSALQALSEALGVSPSALSSKAMSRATSKTSAVDVAGSNPILPELPRGQLTAASVAVAVAHCIPENAIVCDEAITVSHTFGLLARQAAPHDLLQLSGGSIGVGVPMATGAAIACPDRPVLSLQADGSAMYTLQGLWTQAREGLNVVTVLLANRRYEILYGELANVGGGEPGSNARDLFDLDRPAPDWCALARGFGVEAVRADTVESLLTAIRQGLSTPGPFLVEAVF